MAVSSKPLRSHDIKKEILLNNKDLDAGIAELIAMLTIDLIEEFGEKHSKEIISKVINTRIFTAAVNAGKKEKRMETINDILRREDLYDWTILRSGENNPTFAAKPFIDGEEVVDTKRYLIIPANYSVNHYDFQGKLIGELIKLVTNTPYIIKDGVLETTSVYSKITRDLYENEVKHERKQ